MPTLWGYLDPAEHAHMLLDRVRVDAFARAIAAVVRPGDVVLDVGAGSGVLAILAARAGARRVYAIERSGAVELARRHVADNGVADVVEVIRADLLEPGLAARLAEPPRVVVGEQLGNFAPAEHQHRLFAAARRLAAPDAVLIPARYRFVLGAVRATALRADLAALAALDGVRLTGLVERLRRRPAFVRLDPAELLGAEVEGPSIDAAGPPPATVAATVRIADDGEVGGVTAGFVAELAPGIELRAAVAAPWTHWQQTLFPIEPLAVRAGDELAIEIVPRVVTSAASWSWSVRRGADRRDGDGADAMIGDAHDLVTALGGRVAPRGLPAALRALAGDGDLDALAARMQAAAPARYPNLEEAKQDLLALVAAAARL